jgi:hypothetical protein
VWHYSGVCLQPSTVTASHNEDKAPSFQTRRLEYEGDAVLSKQLTSAFNHHAIFLAH